MTPPLCTGLTVTAPPEPAIGGCCKRHHLPSQGNNYSTAISCKCAQTDARPDVGLFGTRRTRSAKEIRDGLVGEFRSPRHEGIAPAPDVTVARIRIPGED